MERISSGDLLALRLVVQMCANQGIKAAVVRYTMTEPDSSPVQMSEVARVESRHLPTDSSPESNFWLKIELRLLHRPQESQILYIVHRQSDMESVP